MFEFCATTDEADIPDLITLAKEAHEESRFKYTRFDGSKAGKIIRRAFGDDKRFAVFLARKRDVPVGFAYCSISEYHIGSGHLLTSIHNINVSKSVRSGLSGGKVAVGLSSGTKAGLRPETLKRYYFMLHPECKYRLLIRWLNG